MSYDLNKYVIILKVIFAAPGALYRIIKSEHTWRACLPAVCVIEQIKCVRLMCVRCVYVGCVECLMCLRCN